MEVIVKWVKTLFFIGKISEKWNENNNPESRRYDSILRVSGSMHASHTKIEESLVSIEKELVESWSLNLYDIAKDGLEKTQNNHDEFEEIKQYLEKSYRES